MKSCSRTSRRTDWCRLAVTLAAVGLATGYAWAQAPRPECVDAKIGSAEAYNCLNRQFQDQVTQQHQGGNPGATVDARSPAPQVGTYNQAAVREHLGANFGKSTVPQRPPPPVFTSPLISGRH
jgi:hypothetical protein